MLTDNILFCIFVRTSLSLFYPDNLYYKFIKPCFFSKDFCGKYFTSPFPSLRRRGLRGWFLWLWLCHVVFISVQSEIITWPNYWKKLKQKRLKSASSGLVMSDCRLHLNLFEAATV